MAKAIFDAETPIISAVGHETDTTIADFVAEDGHGKVHVFEVKFGSGRLTENQKSSPSISTRAKCSCQYK